MQKVVNTVTETVHVASERWPSLSPHCGAHVLHPIDIFVKKVPMSTEVTCGRCRHIFKHDNRINGAGAGRKAREMLLKEMKNLLQARPSLTNTFPMIMEPDTLKALIHFMENYSSAMSMSQAINEIVPKHVRKLNTF